MSPEHSQRVYAIFEAALKSDPEGRVTLLDGLCGDDPRLRADVEKLLIQDAAAERDGFMTTPVGTERVALQPDWSTDKDSEFDPGHGPDGTCAEVQTPRIAVPPELAGNPDYAIKRELGRGGMGLVYLVENRLTGRNEVLKVLGPQITGRPGSLERFLREIRAVAKLSHPNIVTAHTAVRLGDSIVLTMEYIDGLDLSEVVKARGPLNLATACDYVRQAALGLQHANEHGLVHRDIKPSNLMLTRQGDRDVIKVLDFGLAKVVSEESKDGALTHDGQMLGTPDYIAPEQITDAGRADIRADIYSLGCTLYFLLTGGPPFQRTSIYDTLQAHHSADATPLNEVRPDVPAELAALVAKMMVKEPERRFERPAEVAEALLPFLEPGVHTGRGSGLDGARDAQAAPSLRPIDASSALAPAARRRHVLALAAAGSLLVALVAASVMIFKTRNGTIVFENLPAKSVVIVDGDALTVEWPDGKGKGRARVTIPPGQHWVEVKVNGVQVSGDKVSVGSGGVTPFVVRIDQGPRGTEPPVPPATRNSGPRSNPESFVNTIGMEMKLIPAGSFMMGSPDTDRDAADDEKPRHPVRITRPFYLGVTEVTQGQFLAVTGANPSVHKGSDQLPVENVTWDDATAFCNKLSEKEGLKPYYQAVTRATLGGDGYRLPAEAEWEYACRADSETRYCFCDEVETPGEGSVLEAFAWYNRNSDGRSREVGRKRPNAFGLFDMHGSVWELCSDAYDPRYYSTAPEADPFAPASRMTPRATRGGCFNDYTQLLRSALRRQNDPGEGGNGATGFRVARGTSEARRPTAKFTGGGSRAGGRSGPAEASPPPATREPGPGSSPESFVNTVGMTMRRIPAGSFEMGSRGDDIDASPDERPQHRVRISRPFYLGACEVTRGQFRRFVEATGYRTEAEGYGRSGWGGGSGGNFEHAPRYFWLNPGFDQTDEHPVVIVSWNDAMAFCRWLSRTEGRIYRLPTEAEWEYACRAGTTTKYFSGDDPETLAAVANVADGTARESFPSWRLMISARDGFVQTAPVGRLRPNEFGLYDMHGNVWEWCNDGYEEKYYKKSPGVDPPGPTQAPDRVTRGGGWVDAPVFFRSAERQWGHPSNQIAHLGFRVALDLGSSK